MPIFKYKATTADGAEISGIVEAYDEFNAVDQIRQNNMVVKYIKETEQKKGGLNTELTPPKIKEKNLSLMCSQFAIVLRSGMPIVRATEMIAKQTADKVLNKLLIQVAQDVGDGFGLAASFENKGKEMLPVSFIETVRAGEESGSLDVSFEKLADYFDRSAKTKQKVKSAMIYPVFLLGLAAIVIGIVMTWAVPTFAEMLFSLDAELPAITRGLIAISDFFAAYWLILLIVIVALIIGARLWSKTEKGRMFFAKAQLKIPILGNVARMKGASQLASTMNTMLSSGLTMVRTVTVCSRVLDNHFLATRLESAIVGLEEGRPLGACLAGCGCFPPLLVEMVSVGEQAGNLEETLDTVGAYYENETAVASERALGALQPAMTVILGLIIAFIVVALYLPMFTMYNAM